MCLPITPLGLGEVDPRQLGGALGQRLHRDLDPGADHAAEVLARAGDGVEGDRGAEVDHDARPADASS